MGDERRSAADADRAALGSSFRLLSPWLERNLRRLLGGSGGDVDDVIQESFLRFGRYGVEARGQHPKALLMRIASNVVRDGRRRESARGGGSLVPLDDGARDVPHHADPAALIDLKDAIASLPPALRETFLLARFTPMTNDEIARRLGISTKTVEWRISRAVSICLQRLERERGSR